MPKIEPRPGADHPGSLIDILGVGDYVLPETVNGDRFDLVCEFLAKPIGRHSDELQLQLSRIRSERAIGRYILVRSGSGYWLAECPAQRGQPYRRVREFERRDDAERFAFALRWKLHTGRSLPGFELPPTP